MKPRTLIITAAATSVGLLGASPFLGSAQTDVDEGLTALGVYDSGDGEGGSEIIAFDAVTNQMFTTNGVDNTIDVVDVSNPAAPTLVTQLDISSYGAGIQSVAVGDGLVAAAVANADPVLPGAVAVFTTAGAFDQVYTVGVLPDSIAFTPDGRYIVVANEAEPVCDGTSLDVDPAGSISIIDTQNDTVATADFTDFDGTEAAMRAENIRIFFPGSTASQDLEPEYVAITPDGTTAHVTLQENNAIAVVDIATATVTDIVPLGYKDHSLDGNGLDPSNRDNAEAIATWNVLGMYQPDAISVVDIDGTLYTVSANEGDARDYDCFSEEERVGDFGVAQPPYAATDGDDENLGRLRTTSAFPTTFNGAGEIEQVYSYGARSFTIRALDGTVVFDSGDDFEQRLLGTDFFNLDELETDERSDDKGPEPEALAVGVIEGRTFAFIGLERSGGVMMYDISTPSAPVFIDYLNTAETTDQAQNLVTGGGDVSPEGIAFISAADSPTGVPLLAVSFEVSGTSRLMRVDVAPAPVDTTTTTTTMPDATTTMPPATATPTTAAPVTTANPVTELPATGSSNSNTALIALLLLCGGGAVLIAARRRPLT
ncbi:MAG: choice-of-anchor I family protein [Ilumatobacter sp.]|uniref:choice-of-anchor I family protein n=1 Tax=Ilumatobacter sp. TaxID=1967498 RepID=UPI00391DBA28